MALTSSETFGTVVPGFVTDLEGNLVVTTNDAGSGYGIVPGFITDPDGRLLVTQTTTDAIIDRGFSRSPDGALVIAESGTPVQDVIHGFITTPEGYLLVAAPDSPTWQGGLLRNAGGILSMITTTEE